MSKNFSDNFKLLRKQRNLTQEQIAEMLGVSCQAVSKWETNSSYPDISLLPIIADYFGVSVPKNKALVSTSALFLSNPKNWYVISRSEYVISSQSELYVIKA